MWYARCKLSLCWQNCDDDITWSSKEALHPFLSTNAGFIFPWLHSFLSFTLWAPAPCVYRSRLRCDASGFDSLWELHFIVTFRLPIPRLLVSGKASGRKKSAKTKTVKYADPISHMGNTRGEKSFNVSFHKGQSIYTTLGLYCLRKVCL